MKGPHHRFQGGEAGQPAIVEIAAVEIVEVENVGLGHERVGKQTALAGDAKIIQPRKIKGMIGNASRP